MSEWCEVRLGAIATKVGSGATPRGGKRAYVDAGISLIRSMNVLDSRFDSTDLAHITEDQANGLANVVVQQDDILLNITGASVARCCLAPAHVLPARVNQHVAIVRLDRSAAVPGFVQGYLVSPLGKSRLLALAQGGATREALTKSTIESFSIPLPELFVQKRIAEILGAIDTLIENNRRRIALLEEMAQAIYREWFVRLRYPGHERDEFIDSQLGRIPAVWHIARVQELATIVRGRSYRKQELVEEGGMPFINLKCIERSGGFRRDGLKRYAGPFKPEQVTNPGDIVLAVTDLTQARDILARATLTPHLSGNAGVISLDVARVVPRDTDDRVSLFAVLRYSDFAERVKEFANGSTVLHLSPDHIAAAEVVWPSKAVRRRMNQAFAPMVAMSEELENVNDRLANLRDLLLPKLVTGEIDVSKLDLDGLLEESAA